MPTIVVSGSGKAPTVFIPQRSLPVTLSFSNLSTAVVAVGITPVDPDLLAGEPDSFAVGAMSTKVTTVVPGTPVWKWKFTSSTERSGDIEITP